MDLEDAGVIVKYLIRDRDAKFPALFDQILVDAGIQVVLTGVRILPVGARRRLLRTRVLDGVITSTSTLLELRR
ncbi:hypothetical protein [Streptacidiphilus melanogenes]|uniref:hypothetical protein n=1 Tax=Streptacidiphilus melanogenes TaxID=411235 RepID=UPI0006936B48